MFFVLLKKKSKCVLFRWITAALELSWVERWAVSGAWAVLSGTRMEEAEVDRWHTQEEASAVGVLSSLALEVPWGVRILWEERPSGEEAWRAAEEHAVDLIQGVLGVEGPFQEALVAWASEVLLDACWQEGNVGGHHPLVLVQMEESPLWASLAASTQEAEPGGKQEACQAYPSLCQEWSGLVLGQELVAEHLRKAGGACLPGTEDFEQQGAFLQLNHDVLLWNLS